MILKAVKGALEIVLTSGPKEYYFMVLEEVLSLRVCSQWFCVGEQLIFLIQLVLWCKHDLGSLLALTLIIYSLVPLWESLG